MEAGGALQIMESASCEMLGAEKNSEHRESFLDSERPATEGRDANPTCRGRGRLFGFQICAFRAAELLTWKDASLYFLEGDCAALFSLVVLLVRVGRGWGAARRKEDCTRKAERKGSKRETEREQLGGKQ